MKIIHNKYWEYTENWTKLDELSNEALLMLWVVIREIQNKLDAVRPGTQIVYDLPGGYQGSYKTRCIIKKILEELQRIEVLKIDEIRYKNENRGIQGPPWYAILIIKKETLESFLDKVIKERKMREEF